MFGWFMFFWLLSAWMTHICVCLAEHAWGFLIAGAFFFPIGIIHGTGIMVWSLVMDSNLKPQQIQRMKKNASNRLAVIEEIRKAGEYGVTPIHISAVTRIQPWTVNGIILNLKREKYDNIGIAGFDCRQKLYAFGRKYNVKRPPRYDRQIPEDKIEDVDFDSVFKQDIAKKNAGWLRNFVPHCDAAAAWFHNPTQQAA